MSASLQDRTSSIEQYDVLGRAPLSDLEAVVELAARICAVPMATVNLITETEQHQVATYGFDAAICRRADSMCNRVLGRPTPVVVADASLDPRFRANPFVTGELGSVRFYASHKLVGRSGMAIGTLCVFDIVPRTLDETQLRGLGTLADGVVDILELRASERELAEANERLAVFAKRVSHDLKGPLTTVTMSMDMLREQIEDGVPDRDGAGRLLERALRGSVRMNELIDDVLHDAASRSRGRSEPVALDDVAAGVVSDLSAVLGDAEVEVGPLPVVAGHAFQLRAVLQNLLDNAAKYRRPDRRLRVVVSAERVGAAWRLRVADNGVGVPADDRERVLEAGERADNHEVGGSGLGLDTARRAVAAHQGRLGIEDTPGGGATVWFELPD